MNVSGLKNSQSATRNPQSARGSVLVIVLWVALGLVSITLYFANSMSFELRASDNRVSGVATEQAIDGAARYISSVLLNFATNGAVPDTGLYQSESVAIGDCRLWLLGRDTNDPPTRPDQVFFGLVDEASRINLNTATYEMLEGLPRMTPDLAADIISWRTNSIDSNVGGAGSESYSQLSPPYLCKSAPFETAEELRLVYSADFDLLLGEDLNRNGILDPNEADENRNGLVDAGVLEYVTVYTREPNTRSDGSMRVNIRAINANNAALRALLQTNVANVDQVMERLTTRGGNYNPLRFYAVSGMSPEEFAAIADEITTTTNAFIEGRINVNTASAAVLACLPGLTNRAQELVSYRTSNPDQLTSIAWVIEALGLSGNEARQFAEQLGDRITTRSYQFTADVAALGPHGRGYRRVRYVFDTSEGTPKIIYRRELTDLGWALGKQIRQAWLAKNTQ